MPTASARASWSKVFLSASGIAARSMSTSALLGEANRGLQHRQGLQAEEVEFDQARLLDPLHVELGDRHVGLRIAIQRHQLGERAVADHDAGRVGRGVAVEPFELLRDRKGARHHRLAVARRLQARLIGDRARQRHRRCRVLRHQLAQLVDLAVRHFQHAPDVTQHAARLQGAERDDLRDLITPVFLLHVADHLVAPVLAEVDVEVGHRHALGIEEALEQQPESHRVEIRDGERIGDQRAGAGAAARTDRDALLFRPLDEVGDDQEVAGVFHPGDHLELERQPVAIVLLGLAVGNPVRRDAAGEALLGARVQLGVLVDLAGAGGELRQDRLAHDRPERATLGDLDGGGERLRQVGEQPGHLGAGLEAVFGGELPPSGLGDQPALGDADQRVMGLVVVGGREQRLVGRDQRQTLGVGEVDEGPLGGAFLGGAMALQLDVEPVAEQPHERLAARRGERRLPGHDRAVERPTGAAGERDHAVAVVLEPSQLEMRRLIGVVAQKGARVEPHQVAVALLAAGQQHDAWQVAGRGRDPGQPRAMILIAEIDRERAADDRLDPGRRHLVGELQRPEHVVGVGERQRRLAVGLCELGQPRDRQRAFQQRIGRVDVQMHEAWIGGHGRPLETR